MKKNYQQVDPTFSGLECVRGAIDTAPISQEKYFSPYDEFTGTRQTPFGYAGEIEDGNGLVYLRQRYYHRDTGTFPSLDRLEGTATNPMSLNRYAYANGNPVNLIDRSGMIAERPERWERCLPQQPSSSCPPTPTLVPTPTFSAGTPTHTIIPSTTPTPTGTPTFPPGQLNSLAVTRIAEEISLYAKMLPTPNVIPTFANLSLRGWSGNTEIVQGGQLGDGTFDKAWEGTSTSQQTPYILGAWMRSWDKEDEVATGLTDHNCKQNVIAACSGCDKVRTIAENQNRARGVTLHFRQVAPICPMEFYFSGGFGINLPQPDEPVNNYCGDAQGCLSLQFFTGFPLTENNTSEYISPLLVQQSR